MKKEKEAMRKPITTLLLMSALSAVPVVGFAATAGKAQTSPVAKHASANAVATHATRGIVKSVDAQTLVVTRTGKKHGEITFVLNPSTHREGTLAVGAPVSVRYRQDGKTYVATAISVHQPRQQAARTAASKR
jgi:Cu/Ag efflux protein CusF